MIGKLKGIVDSVEEEALILDVNGVGYLVSASARTLRALPAWASLRSCSSRRMCARTRSGFTDFSPRASAIGSACCKAFRGSAPRSRWGFLAPSRRKRLNTAVARQDKAMMARAPGVGPKLAARLVLELKDKAPAVSVADFAHAEGGLEPAPKLAKAAEDAILALVGLGYGHSQAEAAVARISGSAWTGGRDRRAHSRGSEGTGAMSDLTISQSIDIG